MERQKGEDKIEQCSCSLTLVMFTHPLSAYMIPINIELFPNNSTIEIYEHRATTNRFEDETEYYFVKSS